ncbi:E3 ubiquitin-protein ligase synoviolin A-like isoform X2 [Apostichopus japonicus]|uniref:E3 ubiquitin-protein ligase synoviolin A-like isoform X2 n=1 Tax=Stichopus japonicus TaxID=307972 RepID=UPI003AB3047A
MINMRGAALTTASFVLTAAVVGHAYYQKKQFYPSVVYITKSNPSMAVLYIQAFVFVILMGKLVKKVFFGQLRASEMEHLIERSWYAVTETCLAFTVFRDDFSPKFVAMFTLLLFLKCFHWLAEDRVDYMERSPVISVLFHLRVLTLLLFLGTLDSLWVNFAYHSTLTKGATVQLVFGFEYAILFTIICSVLLKYVLHTIDLQSENPWENKAVYMLYTDLIMGFIKVFLYTAFVAIMIKIHTFPLFAIRPMYLTMRSFKKAVNDIIMSRRAIRNMNTLYPDATPEELASMDNVCIICREDMNTACKKLPCNHIFHTSCLRSWFQRQQTCPTCRMDVLRASVRQIQQPPAQQPQQPQQPQANNMPQPGQAMPPFPGYPFWLPPFQPGAGFPHAPPGGPPPPPPGQQEPSSSGSDQQQSQTPSAEVPSSTTPASPGTTTEPSSTTTDAPQHAPGIQPNAMPGMPGMPPMPPFMMPPPFPMMPPFGIPPPVPPVNFTGLSDEELRKLEGHERQNVEARVECLRSIQTLLDAAVVQMQQYSNTVNRIGNPVNMRNAPNTPPPSPAAEDVADGGGPEKTNSTLDKEDTAPLKKAKTSSLDLAGLEGASGYTPPTEGELIPEFEGESPDENDKDGIRRRRLQRLQSS